MQFRNCTDVGEIGRLRDTSERQSVELQNYHLAPARSETFPQKAKNSFSDPMVQLFGQRWMHCAADRLKWKMVALGKQRRR